MLEASLVGSRHVACAVSNCCNTVAWEDIVDEHMYVGSLAGICAASLVSD